MASIIDKPKQSEQIDLLDIEKYTSGLIKFIDSSSTPLTIGVQGAWGSGKTSLLNTIKEELCDNKNAKHYGVWINTWEYSLLSQPEETLIKIIIGLIEELREVSPEEKKNAFQNLLKVSKKMLSGASRAGGVVGAAAGAIDSVVNDNETISIQKLRKSLQKSIKEVIEASNKTSFIFFIDDLDRLDPSVAVSVLELLKNLFDLDKCIFVLAIDYSVVVKGLQSKFGKMTAKNEWEFRAFFDKIIQLPFTMPTNSYNVSRYLEDLLVQVNYFKEKETKDQKLLDKISYIVELSVGTNPRSLKRLANTLSLVQIIRGDQSITAEEKIIEFALFCIQNAYPAIYSLIEQEPDFTNWTSQLIYNATDKNRINMDDLKSLQEDSGEFQEKWEENLWRACQINPYLKERIFNIKKLLNLLNDEVGNEDLAETLERLLRTSSVTNVTTKTVVSSQNKDTSLWSIFYDRNLEVKDIKKSDLGLETIKVLSKYGKIIDDTLEELKADTSSSYNLLKLIDDITDTEKRHNKYRWKQSPEFTYKGLEYYIVRDWPVNKAKKFVGKMMNMFPELEYKNS